jgi:hypothetical protein
LLKAEGTGGQEPAHLRTLEIRQRENKNNSQRIFNSLPYSSGSSFAPTSLWFLLGRRLPKRLAFYGSFIWGVGAKTFQLIGHSFPIFCLSSNQRQIPEGVEGASLHMNN